VASVRWAEDSMVADSMAEAVDSTVEAVVMVVWDANQN
jgi:hypothetical protein